MLCCWLKRQPSLCCRLNKQTSLCCRLKRQTSLSQARDAVPAAAPAAAFCSGSSDGYASCQLPFFTAPGSFVDQATSGMTVIGKTGACNNVAGHPHLAPQSHQRRVALEVHARQQSTFWVACVGLCCAPCLPVTGTPPLVKGSCIRRGLGSEDCSVSCVRELHVRHCWRLRQESTVLPPIQLSAV